MQQNTRCPTTRSACDGERENYNPISLLLLVQTKQRVLDSVLTSTQVRFTADRMAREKLRISMAHVTRCQSLYILSLIRLSELPLSGKILAVYKSIGSKPQVSSAGSYKRGRLLVMQVFLGGRRLRCVTVCDMLKDLSKWNKQELQAYLIHHNLKKSGSLTSYKATHAYLFGRTRIC